MLPEAKNWLLSILILKVWSPKILHDTLSRPITHKHFNFSLNTVLFCCLAEKVMLSKVNSSLYYILLLQPDLTYSTDAVDACELKRL